jgi:hypothetical protein
MSLSIPPTPSLAPSFVPLQAISSSLFPSNVHPSLWVKSGPSHSPDPGTDTCFGCPDLRSKRNSMPTNRGGKTRGEDVTPWISTSSSIAKRLMKRVGDRWSRRSITTTAHQSGSSPANAVDGENKTPRTKSAGLVCCILISSTAEGPSPGFVGRVHFIVCILYTP